MVLDRLLGDENFFANFLAAETLSEWRNDFFFTVAEERLLVFLLGQELADRKSTLAQGRTDK